MFTLSIDDRLSKWIELRSFIDTADDPLAEVWDFWHQAPFVPHNKNIDPYYQKSWPSPWEIIAANKYDDFTKALMIGWTLKLTSKFKNNKIILKTLIEPDTEKEYNLIYVDEKWVINYSDNGPISVEEITDSFHLQNLIEVNTPR